ncbi:MAG TPA: ECF-type sigma factor, partial [Chthoniobacter sp.]|nr:ECF-type sigma factor [Chthoniobacter sp.]
KSFKSLSAISILWSVPTPSVPGAGSPSTSHPGGWITSGMNGGAFTTEALLPLVYEELRRLAAAKMAREQPGSTIQATVLVHEAWLRLGGSEQKWDSRPHFFAAAAEAMRRILIERARRRLAAKRGAGAQAVPLEDIEIAAPLPTDDDQLLALNEALEQFAMVDSRKAELVKLRYFVGLNFEESAAALGIAVPTAKQWWAYARAWLTVEMRRH